MTIFRACFETMMRSYLYFIMEAFKDQTFWLKYFYFDKFKQKFDYYQIFSRINICPANIKG